MNGDRPLVGNAADPRQVKNAARKDRDRRELELDYLRQVLASPVGRAVFWRLLEQCRAFGSVWDSNGSRIHYNAGQQDIGHFILSEITAADEDLLFLMMREARERAKRIAAEAEAIQTTSAKADRGEQDNDD